MRIEDVCEKVQELLDLNFSMLKFDVRSPNAPKLNSIVKDGAERFPLMIEGGEGDYEPYPDVLLATQTFQCHMLVKANDLTAGSMAHDVLTGFFVGKCMKIGNGLCITGMSKLVCGQLVLLDVNSLGALNTQINKIYGKEVKDLEYWLMLDFSIYLTSAKNAGGMAENDNGILFTNQITNTISFTDGLVEYSENYVNVSTGHSMSAATYNQQGISQIETKGTETNVAYAHSIVMPIRNNACCLKLLEMYKDKSYSGKNVTLSSTLTLGDGTQITMQHEDKLMITELELNIEPGNVLEMTLSFAKRLEVGSVA